MMNKKEREQLKLNNLLQECINEQRAIGLTPKNNIEIYFSKDPITKERCRKNSSAFAVSENDRNFIIISRKYFERMPYKEIKRLLHHELIHLNSIKKNKIIKHIRDWKKFTELSNKVCESYDINPLNNYSIDCFENKNSIPKYNYVIKCPKCGSKTYFMLDDNIEYDLNIKCHNCGTKTNVEKKTSAI